MSAFRSACMLAATLGVTAELVRVAPPAMWSWFQAERVLAVDAGRQRQLDGLDPELERMRGITRVPAPVAGGPPSSAAAGPGR